MLSTRFVRLAALLPILSAAICPSAFAQYVYNTVQAPGSNFTVAIGENDSGLVTGFNVDPTSPFGAYRGFVRAQNGTLTPVTNPFGALQSTLGGVNNAGIAAGSLLDFSFINHSAYYNTATDTWAVIPDAPGFAGSVGVGIDNSNRLLGYAFDNFVPGAGFTGSHGYIFNGSYSFFDVPNVDLSQVGTIPEDINESGTVVGFYTPIGRGGLKSGFIRDSGGNVTTLDYPGADETFIQGINNAGIVAGSYDIGTDSHSFLWSSSMGFVNFDLPFGSHTEIWGIDNAGDLTGDYAVTPDFSQGNGFVASVAPEPGSLALLIPVLSLAIRARRKNKKVA